MKDDGLLRFSRMIYNIKGIEPGEKDAENNKMGGRLLPGRWILRQHAQPQYGRGAVFRAQYPPGDQEAYPGRRASARPRRADYPEVVFRRLLSVRRVHRPLVTVS